RHPSGRRPARPGRRRARGRAPAAHRDRRAQGDRDDGAGRVLRAARDDPVRVLPRRARPAPHHPVTQPTKGPTMHPSISGPLLHLATRVRDDRGDVPGWVMVTLMTAIVVAALTPFVS